MRKADAYRLYLVMQGASALFYSLVFTSNLIYHVTVVGLGPLQLVLVGTTLEAGAFLFEIPTGVVADVYSRRLSVILGFLLIGAGFVVEGSLPYFAAILAAQVLWGLGYTFTSGAAEAWVSDEIGVDKAGGAFLRSAQARQICGLLGTGLSVALASFTRINVPIIAGGLAFISLGISLALFMPEAGFKSAATAERASWSQFWQTLKSGSQTVRRQPTLIALLSIGVIWGLYSEGLDRLGTPHLLTNFPPPLAGRVQPVIWLGLLRASAALLSLGATEVVRRKLAMNNQAAMGRTLLYLNAGLAVSVFAFSMAGSLPLALAAFVSIGMFRSATEPIYTAWVNLRTESSVRATVVSMSSQVDALGQIAGGPLVGLLGQIASIRAALAASAGLLLLALWPSGRLLRASPPQPSLLEPSPAQAQE